MTEVKSKSNCGSSVNAKASEQMVRNILSTNNKTEEKRKLLSTGGRSFKLAK